MSFILQCGHDVLLLTTRELILRRDGFRVSNAAGPGDAVRTLAREKVDLLLLCHTLNERELRNLQAIVRMLPDPPRILTLLTSAFPSPALDAGNEIFDTLNGPGTFLAAVHGLLDNHGGRPQPHEPNHGATPCRDLQAQ